MWVTAGAPASCNSRLCCQRLITLKSVTKIDFNLRSKFCFKLYCSVFFLTDTINIVFLFISIITYRYGCSFLLNLIVILFSVLNIAHIKVYKNSSYKWCFISDELNIEHKTCQKTVNYKFQISEMRVVHENKKKIRAI